MENDPEVVLVEPATADTARSASSPLESLENELQSTCASLTAFAQDIIHFSYDSQNSLFDRVNEFVKCLQAVDEKCQHVDAMIPYDVLEAIDKGRNPGHVTFSLLESCSEANNVSRGKVQVMRQFREQLRQAASQLPADTDHQLTEPNGNDTQPQTAPG